MDATLLDSMSSDADVRTPAQKRLAAMHEEDRPAFFGWLSKLLANTEKSPRLRQAASVAMKQAMAATRPRPTPPPLKRRAKRDRAARTRPRQQIAQKLKDQTCAPEDGNLKGLFAMLEGSIGSDEQMLQMLEETVARKNAGTTNKSPQSKLPMVPGAVLPVHQLQLELLQTLAEEERQASYLRAVGKQVQDEQILEKLSTIRAQRTGFDGIGTVASVRSPRAESRPRYRRHAVKPLTADEAFAHALSERQYRRQTATVTTWSARDAGNPRVREWLLNKEMESASQETLDLINWILILTRQGQMTEDRLQAEMATYGPIPSAWLRQIRIAMSNAAYSNRLQRKRETRQPSPVQEHVGVLGISIQANDGELYEVEHSDEPVGLLPHANETVAKETLGKVFMQTVKEMQVTAKFQTTGGASRGSSTVTEISDGSSWRSKRRTGGDGLSPSEAAANLTSSTQLRG